jgi:serine acetyltransferase
MSAEQVVIRAAQSAPAAEDRESLGRVFRCVWSDARRKRLQMGRSSSFFSICLGLLSINVAAVALWRLSIYFGSKGLKIVSMPLYYLNIVLFSFDASPYSRVGPGFVVCHLPGCVLHGKFGANCTIFGRNVVGGKGRGDLGGWRGGPVIGNAVTLGFGAAVLCHGTVGDGAVVGAGAWCFKDVRSGDVVVGFPARFLRKARPSDRLPSLA